MGWKTKVVDLGIVKERSFPVAKFYYIPEPNEKFHVKRNKVTRSIDAKVSCGCLRVSWDPNINELKVVVNTGEMPHHLIMRKQRTMTFEKKVWITYITGHFEKTQELIIKAIISR